MNQEKNALGSMGTLISRQPKRLSRLITLAVCSIALLAIGFAYFSTIDIVVTTQGKIIPSGKSKVIQPLEAGVVKAIYIKDGQEVKAGDILIELDQKITEADKQKIQNEFQTATADVARLKAILNMDSLIKFDKNTPREIVLSQTSLFTNKTSEQASKIASMEAEILKKTADVEAVGANVSQIKNTIPLIEKKYEMKKELAKTGYISEAGAIDSELEFLNAKKELSIQQNRYKESQAALKVTIIQKDQAISEFKAKNSAELIEAIKRKETAQLELQKAVVKNSLQYLKTPIDGIVQQLVVTTIGGVVTQAQQLMTIVPKDTQLEVEAQVLNKDIGYIRVGQRVVNKVETFDFTRFGYIEGEVTWVGTDAINDQKTGFVYPVRIKLNAKETPQTINGHKGIITAGMTMISDIRVDERKLIEYFLSPLIRYKQESMRER